MVRRNITCRNPQCGAEAIPGYDHCPIHLTETETFVIDEDRAARFMAIYQASYKEALVGTSVDVYEWCARGFEIASFYHDRQGELRFCLVLPD